MFVVRQGKAMRDSSDTNVVVCTHFMGIARTVRMALRGMDVRKVNLAASREQMLESFSAAEPDCVILYVDSDDADDEGLRLLNFVRRDPQSPHPRIPVIVISPRDDLPTITAAMNGGAHGYVLFPASGEALMRKIELARASRTWIDRPDYVGPERNVDRQAALAAEAGEKTAV